jgi:hypothetical protein
MVALVNQPFRYVKHSSHSRPVEAFICGASPVRNAKHTIVGR